MITNRTDIFLKLRPPSPQPFSNIIYNEEIKSLISITSKNINHLQFLQEKQCLPAFTHQKIALEDINILKTTINTQIPQIENKIRNIDRLPIYNITLKKNMKEYFLNIIQSTLLKYKTKQQSYLKKLEMMEYPEEQYLEYEIKNIKDIHKSIFFITELLLEMKTLINNQSKQIDRIDYHIDQINRRIRGTNTEFENIPKQHKIIKNRIIYGMSAIIFLIMIYSMLKIYKNEKNK
ncbi:SNARE domain containing protein [Spraguea lophii 42_110]|uniref:SNARE domain containing protein n=1 Tax=Spraguea lophii (strain 42_110) TaxID=1358809 RepID=S7XPC3_SPRLO|nr:SNARE domain containing protein [Spraguea lophii 42_110]